MQQLVHGEILLLRHDHCARFRSPRTNPGIRGPLQTEVSCVFSLVASRFQLARERLRELGVDEETQSGGPQDGVVVLPGGKLQHCAMSSGSLPAPFVPAERQRAGMACQPWPAPCTERAKANGAPGPLPSSWCALWWTKSPEASERSERATRTERAGEAARESACRGVRGAKPRG